MEKPELHKIVGEVERLTGGIFKRMELAEDEITAAMERDPDNADRYNASFMLLAPTEALISDLLYTAHCREMLQRVADDQDTRPGTDAEVLGVFSEATHAAPPNRTLSLAYARMFRRVFPEHDELLDDFELTVGRERYAGDVDELIATVRKKLAVEDRATKEDL